MAYEKIWYSNFSFRCNVLLEYSHDYQFMLSMADLWYNDRADNWCRNRMIPKQKIFYVFSFVEKMFSGSWAKKFAYLTWTCLDEWLFFTCLLSFLGANGHIPLMAITCKRQRGEYSYHVKVFQNAHVENILAMGKIEITVLWQNLDIKQSIFPWNNYHFWMLDMWHAPACIF